jgi:hypothetical protein
VRLEEFDSQALLDAMEAVASLPSPGPEARKLLNRMVAETQLLISPPHTSDSPEPPAPRHRRFYAPYCAAKAHLSGSPRETVKWWRRAAELDTKNSRYLRHYADALEASGLSREAKTMRQRADLFDTEEEVRE